MVKVNFDGSVIQNNNTIKLIFTKLASILIQMGSVEQ